MAQAMFKINEDDLRLLIQSVMVAFGISDAAEAAKKIRASPAWVYRHVRRQIPQPAELEERILAVVEAARSVSWEGELLLPPGPDGFDKCLENQLRHIRRGCVSDPDPSVLPLYENLGNVDFQGKPEASLPAYRCYRGSSQLEGIHGWQAKFLAGPNVGSLATQVLVMDGITRHNRRARRKVDSTAIYPLLDNDLLLRLRGSALDNGGVDLYPKLVMNMTDTGERFGLHYTAALRKILLEEDVEDNTQKAPSPADTVAESDDVDLLHDYEVKAIGMSLDHVMEILQAEHGLAEEERLQRHARAESSGSTSKRLAKLSMFGEHSNFLQKTRPERFSLIMCNKIDSLLEKHGQDFDAVYKEYFRWFLAEKAENPEALIFDTSRYHIEQYANAKKREQANAAARVPDIETGARRTRMRSVLSSGSKPYTPAVASQAEQPRPVAQPEFPAEPAPPVPHKDSKQIPVIEGVRCGLCHQVRKGTHRRPYVVYEGRRHVGPWYCPTYDGDFDVWRETRQMAEFLRIRAARQAGERNRGRSKCKPGLTDPVAESEPVEGVRYQNTKPGEADASAHHEAHDQVSEPPRKMVRCSICKNPRTAATGHRKPRIAGRSAGWYCPAIPGTFDEWLETRTSEMQREG